MSRLRKLYIVDSERSNIDRLEEFFMKRTDLHIDVIGYAYTRAQFMNDINQAKHADIFLISAYLPDFLGVDMLEEIKKDSSMKHIKSIVTIDKNTRNLSNVAYDKGADHTLQVPYGVGQLLELIDELAPLDSIGEAVPEPPKKERPTFNSFDDSFEHHEENTEDKPKRRPMFEMVQKNPILEAINNDDAPVHHEENPKKTIVFTSTGGSGKTTLLVNTAYAIWKHAKNKPSICIVDLDLLFPSVLYKFLQEDLVQCQRDIYDISEDLNYLDEELLKQALIEHEPTGIQILNTPIDPESIHKSGFVKAEHIEQILIHLQRMFDVVLVDTSTNITDDTTLFPLQVCDQAVIVFEPDLASLLSTRKFLYVLKELEKTSKTDFISKLIFVLNKESKKNTVHNDTIIPLLYDNDVNLRIPEDNEITHFSNNGKFIIDNPSPAALPLFELAKRLYPIEKTAQKKKPSASIPSLPSISSLFKKNKK